MKIKNRFFALLILCLSSLLFFSCAKVDDAANEAGINEYGDLNDGYVYIPVGLGLSVDDGESTRTLKHKGYYTTYLMSLDYVMYYGPDDEPGKYSYNIKLQQSETSLEDSDRTKYANILLQIKEQDLGKNFCFSLVGSIKGNIGNLDAPSEGWKISSKGRIFTDEKPNGIESITLSKSTAAFNLKFTFDTIDSLGDEGAKGEFFLNFKPNIDTEGFEYNAVVFLSREVDGEYFEVFGKYFESVDKEIGIVMNSPSLECGQYLIKIYAYVPGKCFGMYSSILEIYGGYNESYYVGYDMTFDTTHVVSSAPDYSVAKSKAIELANRYALTD